MTLHCPHGLLCDWLKVGGGKNGNMRHNFCIISNAVIQANNSCKAVEILKCLGLKFSFTSSQ